MADLCKSCIHAKVCMKDKNLVGDVYVQPNPFFFSAEYRQQAWERYKEREAEGFPCEDYSHDVVEVVRCKDCKHSYESIQRVCSYGVCVDCVVEDDFFCKDGRAK